MITDEMVEKAIRAYENKYAERPTFTIWETKHSMRAALEAVAPMILAPLQAENRDLRNFAVVAKERMETLTDELAKRQELDPQ